MSIVNNLSSPLKNNAQRFEDWTVQVGKGDPNAAKSIKMFGEDFNSSEEYKAAITSFSKDYIAILDEDKDGKISYDEFEKHNINQAKENAPNITSQQLNAYKQTLRTIYDRLNVNNENDSKDNLDLQEVMNYFAIMDSNNEDIQTDGKITKSEYEMTSKMLADKTETGNQFAEIVKQFYEYLFKK